jgi:hypothetical protein
VQDHALALASRFEAQVKCPVALRERDDREAACLFSHRAR